MIIQTNLKTYVIKYLLLINVIRLKDKTYYFRLQGFRRLKIGPFFRVMSSQLPEIFYQLICCIH